MTKNHLTNALMAALLLTFTWLPPATAQEADPTVKTDRQETRASLTVPAREEANPKPAEGSAKEEKAGGQDSIVEQKPDAKAAETQGADGEGTGAKAAETQGADEEGTDAKAAETQGPTKREPTQRPQRPKDRMRATKAKYRRKKSKRP